MQPSPFRATAFEYKFRFILHGVIYALAFYAPWMYWTAYAAKLHLTDNSTWLALSHEFAQTGALDFVAATRLILILALVLTALGAGLRTWATAYISAGIVQSRGMHGEAMLADGPYRRTRNPLYLGTLLHTLGLSILLTPSGAVFLIVLIWIFQVRLALAEEPFLAAKFGRPYLDYAARVPRFLPSLIPRVPSSGARPHWLQAIIGELYFTGVFLTFAIFGWSFNALPMKQGVLISLGLWLVVRAFLPQTKKA
jgi:protein-S-isoprenylcysteine O-methyltransferase Ste14